MRGIHVLRILILEDGIYLILAGRYAVGLIRQRSLRLAALNT